MDMNISLNVDPWLKWSISQYVCRHQSFDQNTRFHQWYKFIWINFQMTCRFTDDCPTTNYRDYKTTVWNGDIIGAMVDGLKTPIHETVPHLILQFSFMNVLDWWFGHSQSLKSLSLIVLVFQPSWSFTWMLNGNKYLVEGQHLELIWRN